MDTGFWQKVCELQERAQLDEHNLNVESNC